MSSRLPDAKRFLDGALANCTDDSQHLRRTEAATLLAEVHYELGESTRADALWSEALSATEPNAGAHPSLRGRILFGQGNALFNQGRLAEAERILLQSASEFTRAFGETHEKTAVVKTLLAKICYLAGRYAEAERLWSAAASVHRARLAPAHPDRIGTELALCKLYAMQRRFEQAEALLGSVSDAASQLGDHPYVAETLMTAASLHRMMGSAERAEPLLRKALAMQERSTGIASPATAEVLLDLSSLLVEEGKPAMAEQEAKRALEIFHRTDGADSEAVSRSETRLATALARQGRYKEAQPLFEHALSILERAYPRGHAASGDCYFGLGEVSANSGRSKEASGHYRRAIEILERTLGPTHPALIGVISQYAKLLRREKSAEAAAFERRANELSRGLGPKP